MCNVPTESKLYCTMYIDVQFKSTWQRILHCVPIFTKLLIACPKEP